MSGLINEKEMYLIIYMNRVFSVLTGGIKMISSDRTGRYVEQMDGYKAFIPSPLPPIPEITIDQEIWSLLSEADRVLGRFDGLIEALPNLDLFVFMYIRKEAIFSNQIAGNQVSLMDVLKFESGILEPDNPQGAAQVINYISAINYGLERLKDVPVSLRLIQDIHRVLMQDRQGAAQEPGEFRRTPKRIESEDFFAPDAAYVPPPPYEMMQALDNLERFLQDSTPIPSLIKIALVHAQFETIHPFLDGNGRTGRLLITFLLDQKHILKYPLLYLSYYFKKYRSEYYDRLQYVRDHGDWEGWLKFFLRGVCEVAQRADSTVRNITHLKKQHHQLLLSEMGRRSENAIALLESLDLKPIFTMEHVESITHLSYPNANILVKTLCDIDIIQEITGNKRNRAFSYAPYLDAFKDL
jgi:Fic family protein